MHRKLYHPGRAVCVDICRLGVRGNVCSDSREEHVYLRIMYIYICVYMFTHIPFLNFFLKDFIHLNTHFLNAEALVFQCSYLYKDMYVLIPNCIHVHISFHGI